MQEIQFLTHFIQCSIEYINHQITRRIKNAAIWRNVQKTQSLFMLLLAPALPNDILVNTHLSAAIENW